MGSFSKLGTFSAATLALTPMLGFADNARDWQNLPTDLNMVFGYYNSIHINTPIDTSLPVDGLSLNANLYIARYARSFAVDGRNSAIQILQPYADISASFDNAEFFKGTKRNGGMADTQVVLVHNIFGGPALTKEEFANWTPETFLTGALWVTAPTGDYDKNRVINIGSNRWAFKPELGFGTPIGPTWLELNTWVSLYGDNDDYHGNGKLEQKPLYALEGHYSYTFNRALWASLDATCWRRYRIDPVAETPLSHSDFVRTIACAKFGSIGLGSLLRRHPGQFRISANKSLSAGRHSASSQTSAQALPYC